MCKSPDVPLQDEVLTRTNQLTCHVCARSSCTALCACARICLITLIFELYLQWISYGGYALVRGITSDSHICPYLLRLMDYDGILFDEFSSTWVRRPPCWPTRRLSCDRCASSKSAFVVHSTMTSLTVSLRSEFVAGHAEDLAVVAGAPGRVPVLLRQLGTPLRHKQSLTGFPHHVTVCCHNSL